MTKMKICGLTTEQDVAYVNEADAAYAGFVLYEKSSRYVTAARAKELFRHIDPAIKKIAVTVSPDRALVEEIERAGFDILQVHGEWRDEEKMSALPVWRAVNLADGSQLEELVRQLGAEGAGVTAVLLDAKNYGSGQTFDWNVTEGETYRKLRALLKEKGISFVLAGGLSAENVAEGIRIFAPDAVDVSSGVEGESGKDRGKILAFAESVRSADDKFN